MSDAVSSIVAGWCAEQNRASQAWWHVAGAAAVAGCCVLMWVHEVLPYELSLLGVLFSFFAWLVLSPGVLIESSFRPDEYVPDDLLARIASSEEIPLSLKEELAQGAAKHGFVTFCLLWSAISELDLKEKAAQLKSGAGFQAVLSYHRPNDAGHA